MSVSYTKLSLEVIEDRLGVFYFVREAILSVGHSYISLNDYDSSLLDKKC